MTAATALKPSNVSKSIKLVVAGFRCDDIISTFCEHWDIYRTMTWMQLIWLLCKLGAKTVKALILLMFFMLQTVFRFGYYLMTPEKEEEEAAPAALPASEHVYVCISQCGFHQ